MHFSQAGRDGVIGKGVRLRHYEKHRWKVLRNRCVLLLIPWPDEEQRPQDHL